MKNILAENMMRFGVKNLSESDVKRIEEVSLNEAPNVPVANIANALIAKVDKGMKEPSVLNGQYLLKTATIVDRRIMGVILGFYADGYIPFPVSFGQFTVDRDIPESSLINPAQINAGAQGYSAQYTQAKTKEQKAGNINDMYNMVGNINVLNMMLNNHPQKDKIMASIANFRKGIDPIKPLLTGLAKTFLLGS